MLVPLTIAASAAGAADSFASVATAVYLAIQSCCVCVIYNNWCAVQAGLESVHSSETMIVRNLLNLVTNAVKHTVRGEIHVAAGFKVFPDRPGTSQTAFIHRTLLVSGLITHCKTVAATF